MQEVMELDPFASAVFAFCNRRRDRMKLLFVDRSGFVMVLKRLTEDRFGWLRRETAVVTFSIEQLNVFSTALISTRWSAIRFGNTRSQADGSQRRRLTGRNGSDSRI